jgi:hypothetical protein
MRSRERYSSTKQGGTTCSSLPTPPVPPGDVADPPHSRPSARTWSRILDGMTEVSAFVENVRLDVLATNSLGKALYAPVFIDSARPANLARFNFLNPLARTFWGNWDRAADDTVAMLRTEVGRDPLDKDLSDLIGELSIRSDDFRVRWAAHNVQLHRTGVKHIKHPVVGDLHLSYEVMDLPADPGLALVAFSAEAGSPTDDAIRFLASWAATHDPADTLATPSDT